MSKASLRRPRPQSSTLRTAAIVKAELITELNAVKREREERERHVANLKALTSELIQLSQ